MSPSFGETTSTLAPAARSFSSGWRSSERVGGEDGDAALRDLRHVVLLRKPTGRIWSGHAQATWAREAEFRPRD
jgi:hypothetical protein